MIMREPRQHPATTNSFQDLGREGLLLVSETGRCGMLFVQALGAARHLVTSARMRQETFAQMYVAGIRSIPVITIVAVFTGMILSLQTGLALSRYNQEVFVGSAVMLSMLREMGPFMTGLILAACVGSSMAAQLGTMMVHFGEVDGLVSGAVHTTANTVRPAIRSLRASWTSRSDSVSRALVASSRIMMGGLRRMARAIARRWHCPPERRMPRSPITVS